MVRHIVAQGLFRMLPLTAIHDSDVLRRPYAPIALAACPNAHSPGNPNASYLRSLAAPSLANIRPASLSPAAGFNPHSRG